MKEVVVEVVDSVMGSSKTTECFNWINKNPNDKYIYVSPMLSEVDNGGRIHTSVLGVEFISPSLEDDNKTYKTKSEHLTYLLENGFNISCTHKLYLNMDESHFKLLEKHQYTVILDEEVEVIRTYGSYSKSDIDYLIENLCEYKEYIRFEYEKLQQEHKERQRNLNEKLLSDGKVVKLFGEYYGVEVIDLLIEKGLLDNDLYNLYNEAILKENSK